MSEILKQKALEIEAKRKEATKFYDDTDAQIEKGEELTTEQKKFIKDLNKTIEEMEEDYKDLEEREQGKEANQRRLREMNRPNRKSTDYAGKDDEDPDLSRKVKTIADSLFGDEQFKAWREGMLVGGKGGTAVQAGNFGNSPSIDIGPMLAKSLVTGGSSTSAGALIENDRKPIIDLYYGRPLTVRELFSQGTTESDTVTFARQLVVTNNAAETAEATETGNGSGAYPESGFTLEAVDESVKTIGHFIPATRQALADAGQMQSLIENFLRYGVDERVDYQLLRGAGGGVDITGVYNVAGVQTQSFDTDRLKTLRKARTKLRVVGRCAPTAWVMHPNDWEAIDLLKDNEARYIYGGPAVLGNPRVWGLPVVESESAIEGTPIGADWRLGMVWDRQQAQMYMSDSHQDFFTRRLIALMVDVRLAAALIRPAAFIEASMN